MTISGIDDPTTLNGATVHSTDGAKLGKVDSIYYDNETDRAEWAAVKSGLFGTHVSLVPLREGTWDGSVLTVPFDKDALSAAPHHDPDTELSPSDEDDLYRHYGLASAGLASAGGAPNGTRTATGPAAPGTPRTRRGRPPPTATAATAPATPGSRVATPPARPPTRR